MIQAPFNVRPAACAVLALLFSALPVVPQTVTRLSDVRKIYVDKMPGNLDGALRDEIAKLFPKTVHVVLQEKDADGVLVETKINPEDVHTTTVNLMDDGRRTVLWSGSTGDRDIWFAGLRKNSTNEIARSLVKKLKKAMHL